MVLAIAAVTTPDLYERNNLTLILFLAGLIGVTAVGQTIVLLTGGIDLSIGAVIGLTTVIVATQTDGRGSALPGAIALALLAGLAVGAANAGLVLLREVPPFVATFATFVLVQGAITAWTRGAPSGEIPDALAPIGADKLVGHPGPAVAVRRDRRGRRRWCSAAPRWGAGCTPPAPTAAPRRCRASGPATLIAGAYLVSAALAVFAGLIDAAYIGHVDAQLSRSLNLDSVAAAVIGGVALTGGRGHIGQTAAGVALLAVLLVWMLQLGAGVGGQLAVEGAAILLAAWLQHRVPSGRTANR